MRRIALALVVAASVALPAAQADAIYCGELDPVCRLICEIKPPCIR